MKIDLSELYTAEQPVEPEAPSGTMRIDLSELFPQATTQTSPLIQEPVEQESGFLATIKKSFQDTFDYLELTALGADGAEGNEQEIAGIISDLYSRSQSVSRSVGHQKILEIASKEGKDISDAEGFIDTTYEVLDGAAKFIWGAITEPIGTAEFIASQAGNQAASLAGMGAGAVAGSMFGSTIPIAGTAVGAFVGARAGAGLAGLSIETGAAYYEALNKAGIDISNQQAVIRAISDPDFQRKMYRQGLTKGITIGAVDALTMGVAKFPGTGSGRALTKELAEEGIDITGKNARQGWAEAVAKHEAGDEAVISAFKKYADAPTPKLLGTKRVAIETAGEGLGEALGGLAAFGETSFEDVALEMLGSGGQSVVQASVVNSLSGAKALKEYATKQTISAQARSVSKGESSNIEPSELNEALRLQNEGVGQSVSSKVTEFIGALEESMDTDDLTIADNVRNAQQEQEYPEYRQALQEGLRNVSNSDFVPMFIAVTKEDQAILASGGRLNRPIKGSTSKAAVTAKTGRTSKSGENFGGQDIVLVKVPIANVIMRGDWSKNELVVDSNGIQLAAVPTQQKQTDATPVADPLATKLNTQADALERQDVETQLKTEIEKGELESQAVDRSQKDVGSDKREASTKGINKLAQIRDPENYETVEDLQSVVDKNKIPLLAGQKRKRPPLALALNNYRDALEKPESAAVINRVLAPTGYKVSKRKDGVYIVPIDDKPALRVPNTGNREVGQSTVDDYLFWIREEQQKGRPEATEKKQQSLRKEAERASSRKAPRQNVQSIIDNIEQNLVTRDGNEISIDEEGLSNLLDNTDNIEGWSKADKKNLDQYVKSIRREKEVESKPKKTPLSGSTITISQSAGALPSLNKSFKRTGKPKFFDRVRKSLSNKKGNDVILELISKAYRKANPGKIDGEIASVLTLTGKADSAKVAKAYALARMLVTLQPSVTTIRPDNSLAIEKGTLSAFMRFDKVIGGVKENQLVGQIRQVFGEDATYTRINDFEVVITNPKLSQINFARRLGRLRGKRNDIKKSELFTAETETLNHNWSKDPTGESIRDEIRRLGFGDILQSLDDRRADYLDIAEEFGATEVAQYRQAPRAPPEETATEDTATEDTEAADEAAFSLAAEDQSSSDSEVGFYFKKDFKNYDSAKFDEGLEFFYLLSDPEQAKEVREKVGDKKFEKIIKSISRVQEARDKFKDIGINVFIYEDVFSTVNGFYQTYYDEADPNKTFGDVHLNISKLKSDYELARTLSHEMAHAVINEKMFRNKSQSDKFFNDVFSDNRASINAWLSTAGAGYVFESKASKAEEWLVWSIESDLAAILTGERKSFSSQIAEIIDRITKILFESLGFKYQREETAQIIKDATSAFINKSPQIEITSEDDGPLFALEKLTAAQKMQRWVDEKVVPKVQELSEDSQKVKFRLPKGLSENQRKKYKTAVGKFFTANNTELNGDVVVASFPLPVSDQLKATRARNVSTVKILTGKEKPKIVGTGRNGKIKKIDIGNFLQDRTRANGRIAIGDYSSESRQQYIETLADEISYQLSQSDNAIGWYEEKVSNMMEVLGVIYPELNTDKNNEMVMKAFLAITSQGTEVDENIRNAVKQYEHYRETGNIRIWGTGKSIKAMEGNHQLLSNLVQKMGLDETTKFLETPYSVRELKAFDYEVSGELMSYEGRGALVFGPKIGSFYGNLYGHYESLTADLWFSRTWNRISGNLLASANVSKLKSSEQQVLSLLKNVRAVKPHLNGYDRRKLIQDAELRLEWAASVHSAWSRKGYKNSSDELRVIKRYDEVNTQLEDAPRNGEERAFMRSVIEGVRELLKEDGIDINTADAQAVLWYHEKDLYAKLGVADSRSEATDYEQAARRLLAQKRPDLGFDYVLRGDRNTDRAGRSAQQRSDKKSNARTNKAPPEKVEAESLLPIDKPASGGLSASGLRSSLARRFGKNGIAKLEADGILKIVESAADLPAGLIKDEDAAQRARGLFDPKTKTAYLIANRLNDITGPKVLLHEVGTHFGLKRMMGAEQYASLLVELDNGKDTVFKPWFDRIRSDYKGRLVEGSEKFAEEVLAAISEDTSDITLSLRERMIRAVKEFLNQFLGIQFSNQIDAKEIGYLVQGSLRGLMSKNQLASTKLPRYMLMEGEEAQLGIPAIAFPEYTSPTRNLTEEHKQYDIVSAVGVLSRKEELRLRRNMNGMMKVAERAYKKGYKNIDVHFPIVSAGNGITSRYAMFKNTQTGTELVIRMSDHPKDPYVAAGSFPFLSYNNGHKQDVVDLTEIDQAVKLLSSGKLDGINGLQFQFEFGLGDGVAGITKAQTKNLSYEQFLTALRKRSEEQFARIQDNAQAELRSGAVIGEDGPLFSLSKRTPEEQALIDKTAGGNARRSAMEILNDNRSRWAEKATQYWVDAYRPIKNLLGDDANRAWQMMQLSENTGGMLHALLNYGTPKPVYRDGQFDWYETDFSNEGLVDILKDLEGEANDFMAWMVYTRANRLSKEDREQNFTQDEISKGLKLNQGPNQGRMASGRNRRVVYQQAMRKMSKLQESVLDMAMDAGVITPEVRADLGTDFYVPFYREFSEKGKNKVAGPTPAHDFVNIRNVIKRLRGSEENINDALHNMTMNWTSLLSASMKNKAGVVAMQAAEKAGAAVRFTDKKQIAQLEFSKGKSKNEKWDKYVFVLEKGEKVWYEVNDPLVLNAMATLAWGGVDNKSIRVLSTFKRWLTIGVTASPAFKIRNMIRDTLQSVGVGKLSYNIFGNASKGYSAIRDDYLVTADMMMGGAMFRFGYYNDDPAAIRRAVEDIGEGRLLNTPAKARKAMGKLFGWYQEVGDRLENANRASLYMQRKAEVGHLQASFESRDLLNFSSHGRGVAAQVLMASLPFLNARLQGLDKLVRSGKGKEKGGDLKRLLAVVGTVTLASILLRLSYEGDEEYDQLEEWQKETYWPIKIGDEGFFFLPKPFEIGAIASIGERITENFIRGMGDKAFGGQTENIGFISKYTRDRIFEVLVHQLALDARPQIMKPVFELWQNKDAFTDRQIENLSWQMTNLPNELRARPYTSELALRGSSLLGDVTEYLSGKRDPDAYLSPVQIDHLIKGYFGWLGATTVGLSEVFFSGDEVKPLKRVPDDLRGLVPIGSFWSSFPPRNNKHMTLFYEQMNEAVALKAAYDGYKRQFKYEEAVRVVTDNMDTFRWVKTYNKANDSIQKINKAISFIYETDTMTPKEKRDKLDELNQSKVDIAKAINFSRAEIDQSENIPSRFPLPSLRSPE